MEHSSPSIETVADMAVLGRALEFPLVVRPRKAIANGLPRLLDGGVWGLRAAGGQSGDCVVCGAGGATRRSRRPRHGPGCRPAPIFRWTSHPLERLEHLNDESVTAMLESAEAFRHLDAIVATPGIDAFTIGPTDLAQDLGVFGTLRRADVLDGLPGGG